MSDDDARRIGRRTAVRTGLGLAWAVPAITLATAVPAVAASTPAMFTLTGTATTSASLLSRTFKISGTVTNTGGTTGTPQIIISFGIGGSLGVPTVSGWTGTTTLLSGGITGLMYTYNGTVAPGASVPFNFTISSTLLVLASMTASVTPPDTKGGNTVLRA